MHPSAPRAGLQPGNLPIPGMAVWPQELMNFMAVPGAQSLGLIQVLGEEMSSLRSQFHSVHGKFHSTRELLLLGSRTELLFLKIWKQRAFRGILQSPTDIGLRNILWCGKAKVTDLPCSFLRFSQERYQGALKDVRLPHTHWRELWVTF